MTSYQFKFNKILTVKEREKDEALAIYQDSVKKFKEAADHLYKLLKKKEDLQDFQSEQLRQGFSIHEVRHYQQFLTNIEKTISYYQELVINARNRMNWNEQNLQEKNIEVKKYEKIREKDFMQYQELVNDIETKRLDEISTMQYSFREGIR
ncbi:flagellar export protein FliJ [Falsibacillus albus]|uniref:Flagellar FliJ protein n=1 Tax=Falsibacillus albus TaxID=2478915 RepID=A0A3L7JZM5_9BACI|nr:flagellar export protein FliJ [Falsibacillus albus]RLQ95744.1 flagellar biosynthesis chaperone FliJ [Falsibacillus albus]